MRPAVRRLAIGAGVAFAAASLFSRFANGSWNPLVMIPSLKPPPPLPNTPGPQNPVTTVTLYDLSELRAAGFGPSNPPTRLHVRSRSGDLKGDTEDMQFSYDVVAISPDGTIATLRNSLQGMPLGNLGLGTIPANGLFQARGIEHPPTAADFPPPLNFGA